MQSAKKASPDAKLSQDLQTSLTSKKDTAIQRAQQMKSQIGSQIRNPQQQQQQQQQQQLQQSQQQKSLNTSDTYNDNLPPNIAPAAEPAEAYSQKPPLATTSSKPQGNYANANAFANADVSENTFKGASGAKGAGINAPTGVSEDKINEDKTNQTNQSSCLMLDDIGGILSDYRSAIESNVDSSTSKSVTHDELSKLFEDAGAVAKSASLIAKSVLDSTTRSLTRALDKSSVNIDTSTDYKLADTLNKNTKRRLDEIKLNYDTTVQPYIKSLGEKATKGINTTKTQLSNVDAHYVYNNAKETCERVMTEANRLADVSRTKLSQLKESVDTDTLKDTTTSYSNAFGEKIKDSIPESVKNNPTLNKFILKSIEGASIATAMVSSSLREAEEKLEKFKSDFTSRQERLESDDSSFKTSEEDDIDKKSKKQVLSEGGETGVLSDGTHGDVQDRDLKDTSSSHMSENTGITGYVMAAAGVAAGTAVGVAHAASGGLKRLVSLGGSYHYPEVEPAFMVDEEMTNAEITKLVDKSQERERTYRIKDTTKSLHDRDHSRAEALAYVEGMRELLGEAGEYPAIGIPRKELIREYEEVERQDQLTHIKGRSESAHKVARIYAKEAGPVLDRIREKQRNQMNMKSLIDTPKVKHHPNVVPQGAQAKPATQSSTAYVPASSTDGTKTKDVAAGTAAGLGAAAVGGAAYSTTKAKQGSGLKENVKDLNTTKNVASSDSTTPVKDGFMTSVGTDRLENVTQSKSLDAQFPSSTSQTGSKLATLDPNMDTMASKNLAKTKPIEELNTNQKKQGQRSLDNQGTKMMDRDVDKENLRGTSTASKYSQNVNTSTPSGTVAGAGAVAGSGDKHYTHKQGESDIDRYGSVNQSPSSAGTFATANTNSGRRSSMKSNDDDLSKMPTKPSKLHGFFEKTMGSIQSKVGKLTNSDEMVDKGWGKVNAGEAEINLANKQQQLH